MRFPSRLLMVAALALPAGAVVANNVGAAGAAGGTTCAKTAGVATFKPPLPKSGSSNKVKPKILVKGAKVTNCSGGGVTKGKFKSTSKFHDATNCDILLGGTPGPHPPTGTIDTVWSPGAQASHATVTLNPVSGDPTKVHVTGTVTSGLFNGMHLDQTLQFAPKTGDCVTTDLSSVTFNEVTPLTIS